MKFIDVAGMHMPAIGLGTRELRGRDCVQLAQEAVKIGYRHFDTAQSCENEAEVAEGPLRPAYPADVDRQGRDLCHGRGARRKKLLDLVVEETHSCYLGDRSRQHDRGYGCGECPACQLRAAGWDKWLKLRGKTK